MLSVQLYDIWFITNGIVQIIVETRVYGMVFLCNLEWKLTATIIVTYCWRRSCCFSIFCFCCLYFYQGNIQCQFHIPTGQCTCAQGAWHNRTFTPRDARLYFSRPVAPNSPDMSPVDYKIWAVMQQQVYEKRVNDVKELRQRLLSVWHSIGQNVIDEATEKWRALFTACVRAKGGHFEHLM